MKKIISHLSMVLFLLLSCHAGYATSIKVAYSSLPVTLDPFEIIANSSLRMSYLIFDPLVRFNDKMEIEGRLVKRWEQLNPTTMRFQLREHVRFHSGNMMTVDDVIWSFKRIKTSYDFKGMFAPLSKIKKIDDYTFDIITEKPYPLVLSTLTYFFVMDSKFYSGKFQGKDKAAIAKGRDSFASTHESGTGPFVVKKMEHGVSAVLQRFKGYWNKQHQGNVDTINLNAIKENATRTAALLSGGVDIATPIVSHDLKRVRRASNVSLVLHSIPKIITFQLNQQSNPALRHKKVRQAIVYAVNNQAIANKIMAGLSVAAAQQAPEGFAGYVPSLKPRYNLAKAKALMKQAGYEDGFKLSLLATNNYYTNDEKIAQAVAIMLSKINIKVELKTMPKAQYFNDIFEHCKGDMLMIGWTPDTMDSANYTEALLMPNNPEVGYGQYNCGHYDNEQVNQLIKASASEVDLKKRSTMLKQVETIIHDDAAFLPLHWVKESWGTKNNILNLSKVVTPQGFIYLEELKVKK